MKRKTFRGFLGVMILFILICISSNSSWAAGEKYPSGPIDLFNPFAPGGTADYLTRFLAKKLESYLGVTVVPQCKPGGGGIVLASFIANARPDGYTMGLLVPENIIEPILLGQASYSLEDFYIIGQVAVFPCVFSVPIDSAWKTFNEFLDYARKNPGVKYGHPGVGTTIFLRTENLNKTFNMGMINIPFKGDSEVIAAVLGKHVPIGAGSVGAAKTQVDAGKMRILFSYEPPGKVGLDPTIPDIRTVFGNITDIEPCLCLVVPKKTPSEVIEVLERAWEKIVVKDPEFASNLRTIYLGVGHIDGKTFMQKLPERMSLVKEMLKYTGRLK